ncbi:MAG: hypothetical protein R3C68_15805 [Myxococcota bacterium]
MISRIWGIRCQNGNPNALRIHNAQDIGVHRISAYSGAINEQSLSFGIRRVSNSEHSRLRRWPNDIPYTGFSNITLRRGWGRYTQGSGNNSIFRLNNTANSTVDCIATIAGSSQVVSLSIGRSGSSLSDNIRLFGNVLDDDNTGNASCQLGGERTVFNLPKWIT